MVGAHLIPVVPFLFFFFFYCFQCRIQMATTWFWPRPRGALLQEETGASLVLWGPVLTRSLVNILSCFTRLQVKSQIVMCPTPGEETSSPQAHVSFCSTASCWNPWDTAFPAELSWPSLWGKKTPGNMDRSFCPKQCCWTLYIYSMCCPILLVLWSSWGYVPCLNLQTRARDRVWDRNINKSDWILFPISLGKN